jgi:hypothetical protein
MFYSGKWLLIEIWTYYGLIGSAIGFLAVTYIFKLKFGVVKHLGGSTMASDFTVVYKF